MVPTNNSTFRIEYMIVMIVIVSLAAVFASGCGGGDNGVAISPTAPVGPMRHTHPRQAIPRTPTFNVVKPMSASYLGDMDGDGDASVGDAIKILRFVVGLDQPTSTQAWLADTNGSGNIDVGDAITVLRAVVHLEQWPLPWPNGGGPPPPPF